MTGRGALASALVAVLAGAGALALLALAAAYLTLRASLPPLDGRMAEGGIAAPVTLERDALGVVTVTALSRADLAFGTGFAHGQDRFFQMDLSRRLAAGELGELVGAAALAQDRETRLFRFRAVAREALAQATPEQRAVLAAYARGVNAGLASLKSRPWEYWLLRERPQPWKPEDSFLASYAMWWELQHGDLRRDWLRRTLDARLGGPECGVWKCALEFLYPQRTAWDSPNVEDEAGLRAEDARDAVAPPVPGPEALDVRGAGVSARAESGQGEGFPSPPAPSVSADVSDIGSNGWAVAGRLTATGAALVASDMHLALQVPPTWYRMRLRMTGAGGSEAGGSEGGGSEGGGSAAGGSALDLNGLTLPGAPVLVAGSNGRIAWAFTNSDGDWLDARPVTCLSIDASAMQTPQGRVPLSTVTERIHVRGGQDSLLPVTSGPQGLLLQVDPIEHRCWFASWVAESPVATNMNLLALERASSVQQALALAPQIGIPEQNLIVGDSAGNIGWTIAGQIPREAGGGANPRLYDPAIGRLWSANARATDDPAALQAIGGEDAAVGAQYTLGARARQIRDALLGLGRPAAPVDMLSIQLDDRALFLARWRDLLLRLLDEPALAGQPGRAEMRRLIASWDAHADVDSVGYRLVRAYHDRTEAAVWQMILRALGVPTEDPPPPQFEEPLWTLVATQPLHLLAAEYPSWRAFLLFELDGTLAALEAHCGALDRCRWGAAHPVRIRHPLARALPMLARLIDLPELELPGDHDMPRVQDGAFGASERFAVSPGHEAAGYLHLPGGESDHPLSPYYRAGFRAWAEGKPLPFLPQAAVHRLLLQPARGAVN